MKKSEILIVITIGLIAFNLRPAISGVGPLIYEIRLDTGLSNALLGFLTTLPLLAFGIFSILTPVLTKKMGMGRTMALALSLLTAGILLRVGSSSWALFSGTLVLGIGIALGNVLLPGIAKHRFPDRFGFITGIYAAMLGVGAAVASGISVPLSESVGLGWRHSLAFWALFSLTALVLWILQMGGKQVTLARKNLRVSMKHLGQSGLAWYVAIYMGMQSLSFYIFIAWLPEILIDRGMSPFRAGWMLSLSQAAGIIGPFIMSSWASRLPNQRRPIVIIILCEVIGIIGLMIPGLSEGLITFCVFILGFGSGSSFGMALLFIGLRARDTETANELSAMSQSIGYSLAAAGPTLFGVLFDLFNSWTMPLVFLLFMTMLKLWSGWGAGQRGYV